MFVLSKLTLCYGRLGGYKAAVPYLIRALSQTASSESNSSIVPFIISIFGDRNIAEKSEGAISLSTLQKQLVENQIITASDNDQV